MITDQRVKEIALGLFRQESARDGQKLIGASDFSDPCDHHLAKRLAGVKSGSFKYWMGAKLGTAVHEYLESQIERADMESFPELDGAFVEKTITLGELDGYGVIKSKPDLVMVEGSHLVDWKTSKRDKSRKLQNVIHGLSDDGSATYTLRRYYSQAQIYAWGLNKEGIEIDGCSLVFINRDGTYEPDVWTYTFEYDQSVAESLWERLESIWSDLRAGRDFEDFERQEHCFNCKVIDA